MIAKLAPALALSLLLAACGKPASDAPDGPVQPADAPATSVSAPADNHIDAPRRNPGWWEFTDVAPNGDELMKTQLCVGEASEKVYSAFDQIADNMCQTKTFTKDGDGWTYTTVCGPPGMKPTTTKGKLTGDIATAYRMDEVLDISVEGDRQAKTAKLLGPCPAQYKDGDQVTMNGAMKSSVLMR